MIDKQALLAALMPQTETVEVEGFGAVNLRQLSVAETDAIRAKTKGEGEGDASTFGLRLIIAAVVDEAGQPAFSEADIPALRATAGARVDVLGKRVLAQNGFATGNAAG